MNTLLRVLSIGMKGSGEENPLPSPKGGKGGKYSKGICPAALTPMELFFS